MPNEPIKMSLNEIRTEPGAAELVQSDNMRPYLEVLKADIQGLDTGPCFGSACRLAIGPKIRLEGYIRSQMGPLRP